MVFSVSFLYMYRDTDNFLHFFLFLENKKMHLQSALTSMDRLSILIKMVLQQPI
jgi:hypothetical protein